jgi:hypothetical protein
MQAGFSYRPVTARRNGTQELPRSVMGEFVSGNYFRTFGLQPQAGRLFIDADDIPGAPMAAVMSYETWQHDYAGDASVVGSRTRSVLRSRASQKRSGNGGGAIRLALFLAFDLRDPRLHQFLHQRRRQWLVLSEMDGSLRCREALQFVFECLDHRRRREQTAMA